MSYTIRRQTAPFTILATITRRDSAERAAQIVANARHIWTSARGGGYAGHSFLKAPVDKQAFHYSAVLTDRARLDIRSGRKTNKQAADEYRDFEFYSLDMGRNAARVLAAARVLFARMQPGGRLEVRTGQTGECVYWVSNTDPADVHYIFRLRSFMRAGACNVAIRRSYDSATANPGQPQLTGSWCVEAYFGGCKMAVHTWHGAHEVSAFPRARHGAPAGQVLSAC